MKIFEWLRGKKAVDPAPQPEQLDPARRMADFAVAMRAAALMSAELAEDSKKAFEPFKVAQHPPSAVPVKSNQMAMDSSLNWAQTQVAAGAMNEVANEGLEFLGYPYLSLLAQRPEYRVFSETIATEATRKWIRFKGTGADETDKSDRIKELEAEFKRLEVRDNFRTLATQDGFFGRSHLFLDLGTSVEQGNSELSTPIIADGNPLKSKVKKGSLRRLQTVEAVWTYPTTYNAVEPLKETWYNPQVWYVMGKEIHHTRLLTFIGHPVPDLLKPAYSFGGLSLSQMAKPYVDIWLKTRTSVGSLIHSFSVMVLATDLSTILQPGTAAGLLERVGLFNALRDNQGAFVINKESEDFKNVSASIAGLHELQAQAQEHMMSVARIPAVKFTGIQPAGLNSSSEGEIRVFYDTIGAYQESFFRPNLEIVMKVTMMSLWGEVDDEITFEFEPLWSLTEKEMAEARKADAETDQIYLDAGVVSQQEVRQRIASDPDTPYASLDVDELPDLLEEEEGGLVPKGAGSAVGSMFKAEETTNKEAA